MTKRNNEKVKNDKENHEKAKDDKENSEKVKKMDAGQTWMFTVIDDRTTGFDVCEPIHWVLVSR